MIRDPGNHYAGIEDDGNMTLLDLANARHAENVAEIAGHDVVPAIVAPLANDIEDPTEDDAEIAYDDLLADAAAMLRERGIHTLGVVPTRVLITMLLDSKRGAERTIARMREHGEGVGGVGAGIAYNEGSAAAYSYALAVIAGLLGVAVGELDAIANADAPKPVDLFAPGLAVTDVDAIGGGE